jgi:hypothetical protein
MSQKDSKFWAKARRARNELNNRLIHHPDVSGIDIGYVPERGEEIEEIVLRIHVQKRWMKANAAERVVFPEQVDGIPVVVMLGEYRLEDEEQNPQQRTAYFQYLGKTGLTVIGPKTRQQYRFDRHGAIVAVDPRDESALAAVSVLRQVGKPTAAIRPG